jgi:hypothetical protein
MHAVLLPLGSVLFVASPVREVLETVLLSQVAACSARRDVCISLDVTNLVPQQATMSVLRQAHCVYPRRPSLL